MIEERPFDKNRFKSILPLRQFSSNEKIILKRLRDVASGEIKEAVIALLPDTEGTLSIDTYKILDITRKHGSVPLENLIITANDPSFIIKGSIDDRPYITLVHEFSGGGFVLSARKYNGHYVVTFFEPSDSKYLESIKRRGTIILLESGNE